MKKNIIIVILIIALLGSVGYTVYDKVLKEDSTAEKRTITRRNYKRNRRISRNNRSISIRYYG